MIAPMQKGGQVCMIGPKWGAWMQRESTGFWGGAEVPDLSLKLCLFAACC